MEIREALEALNKALKAAAENEPFSVECEVVMNKVATNGIWSEHPIPVLKLKITKEL